MKKYFLLLLFTAISYAQTNGVTKLKITANPEKTAATRVVVQDAATGEVGYVNKTTIVTLDATNTTTGKIQLSGDLGGTATLPTVPGLATKENTIAPGTTSQYYRGDKTWQTLDKTAVGLANVDNTSDLNKPISTATQTALNLKENTANKNTANGYAGLGSDGKLISNQLPAITITDTFVVGSQSSMLALTAETGDVAVRTDLSKSYILKGSNPSVLADWQELLSPVDGVTSVFGRVGSVVANTGDYTTAQVTETTNKKYQTDAQALYNDATSSIQTQLNGKQNAITNVIDGIVTMGYIPKSTSSTSGLTTLSNSQIYDNGSSVRLGTTVGAGDELLMVSMNGTTNTQAINVKDQNASANASTFMVFRKSDDTFLGNIRRSATDNALFLGGNDYLSLGTSGNSEKMRITSGGNVGIGTITPGAKLEVNGNGWFTGDITAFSNGKGLSLKSTTNNGAYMQFEHNTAGIYGYFGSAYHLLSSPNNVAGDLALRAEGALHLTSGGLTPRLSILSTGNVGIGTTSPNSNTNRTTLTLNNSAWGGQLDINVGATNHAQFGTDNFNSGLSCRIQSQDGIVFYAGGASEKMRITSTGNVGIGTTNPDGKLNVYTGASVTNATAFNAGDGSNSIKYLPYTSSGAYNDLSTLGGGLLLGNINSKLTIGTWNGTGIQFGPTNTLIKGNVGIDTGTPFEKLHIQNGGSANTAMLIHSFGTEAAGEYAGIRFKSAATAVNEYAKGFLAFRNNGTGYGRGDMYFCLNNGADGTNASASDAKMIISSAGNVAIGDVTGAYKFYVNGGQYGTILKGGDLGTGSEIVKFAKADGSLAMFVRGDGNVGIANATPSEKLTIGGNVLASGFFQSSDLRLKDIISRDGDVIKYKWKDKRDNKIHIGYVAQEVQKENPDQVNADDKGILSVNYIEILVEKIRKLEKEIELLKAK